MPDINNQRDGMKLTEVGTLGLISAIEDGEAHTQRSLANRIGVALGLTNSLLKRAVGMGLLKVKQVPAKRYVYYITPKGFSEKSRLVAEYLTSSLTFFRQAREEYSRAYAQVVERGHKRLALYGVGELAEIAMMSAIEDKMELQGVIHPGSNRESVSGIPVINSIDGALREGVEAVVITSVDSPQEAYEALLAHFEDERIFTVPLLHVSRTSTKKGKR